jgi:glycosyl transferase family 25
MLYVVNLEDAVERRTSIEAQLRRLGLGHARIGIDFRGARKADIDRWFEKRFPNLRFVHRCVSSAEIGCWASHLCAWKALAERDDALACTVLEDDLQLDERLPEALATLTRSPRADIVFLGTSSRNVSSRRREPAGAFTLHRPLGTIYNTWGYVIARDWVSRFLDSEWRIDRPIDHYTGGARARHQKPRVAVLRPAVVREDPHLGVASQIEPYTWRIDRARVVEAARRRIIASRVSALYYKLYEFL